MWLADFTTGNLSAAVVNSSNWDEEDYYWKERETRMVNLKFTKYEYPDQCSVKSLEVHKLSQGDESSHI